MALRKLYLIVPVFFLILVDVAFGDLSRIDELFRPVERREDPLRFLDSLPEISVPPKAPLSKGRRKDAGEQSVDNSRQENPQHAVGAAENQVPNAELARVLLQILAAKKLVEGISLSVTDTEVAVHGTVRSEEDLEEILAVIEKGRENRQVNLEHLVRP